VSELRAPVDLSPIGAAGLSGLERGEIHLWYVRVGSVVEEELLRRYRSLLSATEQLRQEKFAFHKDRHRDLVTRALVRTRLSYYQALPPGQWAFVSSKYGRPEIAPRVGVPPLRFNVSHSGDLVVCGVALSSDIGVDVECVCRPVYTEKIVRRHFSIGEAEDVLSQSPERKRERFFEYWTLKEAYAKALGLGLAIPLSLVRFRLGESGVSLSFDHRLHDCASHWSFWLLRLIPDYVIAIAAACPSNSTVRVRPCVPLVAEFLGRQGCEDSAG